MCPGSEDQASIYRPNWKSAKFNRVLYTLQWFSSASSGFEAVKPTATKGPASGRKLMNQLISQNPAGIVLIVVAGMDYAAYVEAKGLNVLDTSEIMAKKLVRRTLKRLGFK